MVLLQIICCCSRIKEAITRISWIESVSVVSTNTDLLYIVILLCTLLQQVLTHFNGTLSVLSKIPHHFYPIGDLLLIGTWLKSNIIFLTIIILSISNHWCFKITKNCLVSLKTNFIATALNIWVGHLPLAKINYAA